MNYAAVACVRDQAATVVAALRSLRAQSLPPAELLVIDDGSTDGSGAAAAAEPGVRVIRQEPRGLGIARNRGWQSTDCPFVLFLDADAALDPEWIARAQQPFSAPGAERLAGVGGRVREAGQGTVWDRYRQRFMAQNPAGPVEFLPGIAALYRRSALAEAAGFDERLATNGEDLDLGLRLAARGWQLDRCDAAVVTHHRSDGAGSFARLAYRYHYYEGLVRRRHGRAWLLDRWVAPPANFLLTAGRSLADDPALLGPALLALAARWAAALRLTLTGAV